jgi:hypothetical protein
MPPWHWWVDAREPAAVQPSRAGRFALVPAFQPLSYDGRGSGIDPAAYDRAESTILNEYLPQYPIGGALAKAERSGDLRGLEALGVTELFFRRGFAENGSVFAGPIHVQALHFPSGNSLVLPAIRQQLSLAALPAVMPGFGDLAGNWVFAGDLNVDMARLLHVKGRFEPVLSLPVGDSVDWHSDWVRTGLAELQYPEVSNPLEGAFTSSAAILSVPPAAAGVLAQVVGRLTDGRGRLVSAGTRGAFAWAPLVRGTQGLRCAGRCTIAGTAFAIPSAYRTEGTAPAVALAARQLTPWLLMSSVPAGDAALVRYDSRYSGKWLGFGSNGILPHLRVAGVMNGWLLPPRAKETTVVLLHATSALQALLEALGVSWFIGTLVVLASRRKRMGTLG